jgi:hypothetical protein
MFRPATQTGTPDKGSQRQQANSTMLSGAPGIPGEGPWRASCNYWKAGIATTNENREQSPLNTANRLIRPNPNPKTLSNLNLSITESSSAFVEHISGTTKEPGTRCGDRDRWGIPPDAASGQEGPRIRAVIATVPDPLRSSTPWEFDRSIEALAVAAAENGYVGSYFWLPWQRLAEKGDSTIKADAAEEEDRRKEPGLLILKQPNAIPGRPFAASPSLEGEQVKAGVLYLFLVGESPAVGVNGDQLQHALLYERELAADGARLSFKEDGALDVIGPDNSGAAASLRAGLEAASQVMGLKGTITVAGATSTRAAPDAIDGTLATGASIRYLSFLDDIETDQNEICSWFQADSGPEPDLAFMTESGTVFGMTEANAAVDKKSGTTSPAAAAGGEAKTPSNAAHPAPVSAKRNPCRNAIVIQFPRNISLLRNAETEELGGPQSGANAPAAPYLRLSLKDASEDDTVPPFSPQVTPLSQEAQWMAIVRQLTRANVKTIVVSASNSLDALFLVKWLHRDVPDARVVVYDGGDLLYARVGDDQAYLGTVAFGVYPLTEPAPVNEVSRKLISFSDALLIEALYNAAMYTFWDGKDVRSLHLAGYSGDGRGTMAVPPPLWATAVGRDGYYPLGIVSECAGTTKWMMPMIDRSGPEICVGDVARARSSVGSNLRSTPGFSWGLITLALAALGLAQSLVVGTASVWSPLTRDLRMEDNDQPRRRAVYLHIATASLFAMCMITTIPVWTAGGLIRPGGWTIAIAVAAAASGLVAVATTLWQTKPYMGRGPGRATSQKGKPLTLEQNMQNESAFYPLFNFVAAAAALGIPLVWLILCTNLPARWGGSETSVGLFFAFRCLYPASGVSPLVPVLFILITWYFWAALQTRRLRFSENCRPVLPSASGLSLSELYVPDESLSVCLRPTDHCLFENIECLLMTRQMVRRHLKIKWQPYLNTWMAAFYAVLFCCFLLFVRVRGLGHFLRPMSFQPLIATVASHIPAWLRLLVSTLFPIPVDYIPGQRARLFPGWYELLISALFFPLLVISVTGWLRMTVIWVSLRNGLLEPLERSPLRFAFSRLTSLSWMTMLRQGGMFEHWKDMARSRESMQQLLKRERLWVKYQRKGSCALREAKSVHRALLGHIQTLLGEVAKPGDPPAKLAAPSPQRKRMDECIGGYVRALAPVDGEMCEADPLVGFDVPANALSLRLMHAIEKDYARFAELVLNCVLAPYWATERQSLVEAEPAVPSGFEEETEPKPKDETKKAADDAGDLGGIHMAEEYVAIRYVSLIRAVMINIRLLMTFVWVSFVLALLAWNSYPFQPKQWVDWTFTILLFGFGTGVVWVLAQMYRNPILSRITGTKVNELGGEFFWRIVTMGAVPVLTWVGSQVPAIGNLVSKLLGSGLAGGK